MKLKINKKGDHYIFMGFVHLQAFFSVLQKHEYAVTLYSET